MNTSFSRITGRSLISVALPLLVACGGGGGGSTVGDDATYTVGGMVSGLTGTGLLLQDNVDDFLSVAASGAFTFATQYRNAGAYTITVAGQPVNPIQSCAIFNYYGAIARSNVTDVRVTCTNKFSNASLQGSYKLAEIDYDRTGDIVSLATVTFDGAGGFSGTVIRNAIGTMSSSAVSGTYTVAADLTLTLSGTGGSPATGGLRADGSTLVAGQMTNGLLPSVIVGIKQGSHFSNASVNGTYETVDYGYAAAGDIGGRGTLTFDGAGNFTGTRTQNIAGGVSGGAVAGTYVAAPDGTLTMTPAGGSPSTGGLSADGSTLLASQTTNGFAPTVLVGIKQGSHFSDFTFGAFETVDYSYAATGDIGGLMAMTLDGAGKYAGTRTQNIAGVVSSGAVSGTYTVAVDGTLTLSPTGASSSAGGLSVDGNTLIAGQSKSGQPPIIVFGTTTVYSSGVSDWCY